MFSLLALIIRTNYKYQSKNLEKGLMAHMTKKFGLIFKQNLVDIMLGNYIKLMRDIYRTNITCFPNYGSPRLIPTE